MSAETPAGLTKNVHDFIGSSNSVLGECAEIFPKSLPSKHIANVTYNNGIKRCYIVERSMDESVFRTRINSEYCSAVFGS
jgi:hypothetical protein